MTETTTDETVEETPANFAADNPESGISEPGDNLPQGDDDAEMFPRDYVVKLRDENAKYRQRAADRDEIATRLHTALVAATGRLADPTDLAFDDDHIVDPDKMVAAIDELLTSKPHLASRKPSGSIGQGVSGVSDTVSLSGLLKANAS